MAVLSKAEISALTDEQRLELIDELWESLEAPRATPPVSDSPLPEWQRRILDERLLDLENLPGAEISLTEARSRSLI